MTDNMDSNQLARYLAGEAPPEERAAVEAWVSANPNHRAELERLRAAWKGPAQGAWDLDRAWARVAKRLDETQLALPARRRPAARIQTWALVAAALVIMVGATMLWRSWSDAVVPVEVVSTVPGQQQTLDLHDGTRITVAPGSKLTIAAGYGDGERRVELSGEAWFEVTHDDAHPFRVYAGGTMTEDLGTEFGVRAFASEPAVRLVVLSGSASLRREGADDSAAATLGANDLATLATDAATPTVTRGVNVAGLVGWLKGEMVFEDSPLDSVTVELARWYGLTFQLADPALGTRRLTATLRIDELDAALEVLGLSLGVRIDRQVDTVILSPGRP